MEREVDRPNQAQAPRGMDLDFFENVYVQAVQSGSLEASELIARAHLAGALKYEPNLEANQNTPTPLDALLTVNLEELERISNMHLARPERGNIISRFLKRIKKSSPK